MSAVSLEQLAAAPTSAMSEDQLVRGYARVARPAVAIEPCACGEAVVAISRADEDIRLAMEAHVRTTPHRAFSAAIARRA